MLKSETGIAGLDEITFGGLPTRRTTLLSGGPGCGKTVFALQFIAHGAHACDEPGLFISFEERSEDIRTHVGGLAFGTESLEASGKLKIGHVDIEPGAVAEAGDYTLDGLLVRLDRSINELGAKRVAIDSLDALYSHLQDNDVLRRETHRLLRWLDDRGVTTIITTEKVLTPPLQATPEAHLAECVILLDHRVAANIAKRRIRVLKYRGSAHGSDEFPFLIDERGISVFPLTSARMSDNAPTEIVSSGISDLDAMLGRGGYFVGSTILVSGTAGAGKSSVAAAFAHAATTRGSRCMYLAFEESESQIVRNMQSIGIDLGPAIDQGLLKVQALRPTRFGLEEHLVAILKAIDLQNPACLVIDPISNFLGVGAASEVHSMLVRLVDHLRGKGITTVATHEGSPEVYQDPGRLQLSSLMDTWIVLGHDIDEHERRRSLYVAKSRGMSCSQAVRQFHLTNAGPSLSLMPRVPHQPTHSRD